MNKIALPASAICLGILVPCIAQFVRPQYSPEETKLRQSAKKLGESEDATVRAMSLLQKAEKSHDVTDQEWQELLQLSGGKDKFLASDATAAIAQLVKGPRREEATAVIKKMLENPRDEDQLSQALILYYKIDGEGWEAQVAKHRSGKSLRMRETAEKILKRDEMKRKGQVP